MTCLCIGDWRLNPVSGELMPLDGSTGTSGTVRLEERTLRLLLCLAENPGEIVSIEDLLNRAWPGVAVTPDSVYQAISSLRRQLGDDSKQPAYIETVPRLGYRMLAQVTWPEDEAIAPAANNEMKGLSAPPRQQIFIARKGLIGAAAFAMLGVIIFWGIKSQGQRNDKSVAVLPFLDLTNVMDEEPFADGMTEELIGKLSKIPDLRVPSPTASFYYKRKQEHMKVAEIADALKVAYVLDGSVRKSAGRLRVSARLMRGDTGYVTWSETYDRPFGDILKVQDDIASQVTKALQTSINSSRR